MNCGITFANIALASRTSPEGAADYSPGSAEPRRGDPGLSQAKREANRALLTHPAFASSVCNMPRRTPAAQHHLQPRSTALAECHSCQSFSPAARSTASRSDGAIQKRASCWRRSSKGATAMISPRCLAWSKMPGNPMVVSCSEAATARPSASSMSTKSAPTSSAKERAAISPA